MTKEGAERGSFARAAEARRAILKEAEAVETGEIEVSASLGAIISGFPQDVLQKTGILILPLDDGGETVQITASKDRLEILKRAFDQTSCKGEGGQDEIKSQIYKVLYRVIQASATPGVEPSEAIGDSNLVLRFADHYFPPLRGLVEYLEERGQLTDVDQEQIVGLASGIFSDLEERGSSQITTLKAQGYSPKNMFAVPDLP